MGDQLGRRLPLLKPVAGDVALVVDEVVVIAGMEQEHLPTPPHDARTSANNMPRRLRRVHADWAGHLDLPNPARGREKATTRQSRTHALGPGLPGRCACRAAEAE